MWIKAKPVALSRRDFLRAGLYAVGVSTGLPALLQRVGEAQTAQALGGRQEKHPDRILVVVELTGGNDGLNTVVPFADAAYHNARPRLAVRESAVLKLNDQFGVNPACRGLERLFKNGKMAIPNKFEEISGFFGGRSGFKQGSQFGYMNASGKVIVEPKYGYAHFYLGDLAGVAIRETGNGSSRGYIDKNGKVVWAPKP